MLKNRIKCSKVWQHKNDNITNKTEEELRIERKTECVQFLTIYDGNSKDTVLI